MRITSFSLVALFSVVLLQCKNKEPLEMSLAPEFPVTEVVQKDTVLFHEYVADVHALRYVEIRARVQGYLEAIYIDEGKFVKAGQVLFKINDEEYKAEVAKAKALINIATAEAKAMQVEVDRVVLLVEKNVVGETELRFAKAKAEVANAKVEEAKSNYSQAVIRLSHTIIRAPFDGLIDRIPFKIGSLINEGHLLTSVFDSQSIYAYFRVSEKDYLEYIRSHPSDRNSSDVELVLADGTHHTQVGKIETLEGEFDTSTGTIAFRAKFPNPNGILKHGSSGKVRLSNTIENALMVPQKATFEIQDKTFVFLVDKENKVRMKSFVPGSRLSHFYIVESGLVQGDRVVYEGIKDVRDGMEIKATGTPADNVLTKSAHKKMKTAS
jgi:membrane fusion protein, multidrug efflux system